MISINDFHLLVKINYFVCFIIYILFIELSNFVILNKRNRATYMLCIHKLIKSNDEEKPTENISREICLKDLSHVEFTVHEIRNPIFFTLSE